MFNKLLITQDCFICIWRYIHQDNHIHTFYLIWEPNLTYNNNFKKPVTCLQACKVSLIHTTCYLESDSELRITVYTIEFKKLPQWIATS